MAKILLHCPLNISRSLVQMMEEFCREFNEKHNIEVTIETQPHRPSETSLFEACVEKNELPDITVGHVDDFADLPPGFLAEHFKSIPGRFPIRKELADKGWTDNDGYFHPFVVIPFAIFYNKNLLGKEDIPQVWQDLLDDRWEGKILMPDAFRIVSLVVKTFMKTDFPKKFDGAKKNFVHQASPMEVITAVDEGRYPIGITNIAFARISKQKNTRIIWPKDGLFCMPQVMVYSRNAADQLFEIGDFLMSDKIQNYLALQSFVPAAKDIPMHQLVTDNQCNLRWKGWNYFLQALKGRRLAV
ncbi:ABC transporter substrate-binding protein [uncultured Desulfobacter sp.]|uniref:ABC transporter substrate-binding protein n=1 Tax=uncultured Desulfobacter sp. TaxID=240139 RepID=UPI002AAAFD12|nr:ABC transporter substrate-binding protein [uncultured Desulfobacter sp.]